MDGPLRAIFDAVPADELAVVAAGALGVSKVALGHLECAEIRKPHADPRTIGIVRVSGTASIGGETRHWSSVTKLIDMLVTNTLGTPVDPRNEALVYERGYFTDGGGGFRPARCYHISRPRDGLTILWLEDLTDAEGPPFGVGQLSEMALHLGAWNAQTAAQPPVLDFPIGNDFHLKSAAGFDFPKRVDDLLAIHEHPMVREMYARQGIEIAGRYVSTYLRLAERSKTLPHALALADCPVSNFFHRPGETIAIDWAGLGSEPLGADGGRFLGSALTWGRSFAEIAAQERVLFESYLAGLREAGAREERRILRSGYLCELGFYLCTSAITPVLVTNPRATLSVEFFEKRLGMPVAEFGNALAPVIDLLPGYIDEIDQLLS